MENKQRVLPVMDNENILGVITRTDLLNIIVQESNDKKQSFAPEKAGSANPRTRNITAFMKERLSKRIIELLRHIGETAEQMGYSAYVVGGFVRDLFLYRHNEDIDIVIEGDGIAFAKRFSSLYDARINTHEKFGTALIIFPDGFKIDVASARREYYQSPAALPTVEMSSIKMDLFRRDFTVNTLSVALNPPAFGHLIDFFGAQRDLKEKVIRILHNLSFVEDPTRAFRAVRFEQRFGFTIGKLTAGLIENAVRMDFFKQLSGCRIFSELSHILKEDNPIPCLIRLNDFHLLDVVDPAFVLNEKLIDCYHSAKKVISWFDLLFTGEAYMKWAVYFLVMLRHMDGAKSEEICRKLELAPKYRKIFVQDRLSAEARLNQLYRIMPGKPSDIYRELHDLKIEQILYIMAITTHQRLIKDISTYVTDLRHIRLSVSGKDLAAMGLSPSPVYGKILGAVMDAKLNGRATTREEEMELLEKNAAGISIH
jgi:tRNA nucleotidyltransferase (CCA-adding enzyme)